MGSLIAALAGLKVKHALNPQGGRGRHRDLPGLRGRWTHGRCRIDRPVARGDRRRWPTTAACSPPTPVRSGRQMDAAMVMGAAGVWTGSLWLTVEEAAVPPKQMETYLKATSRDTVRSRSWTGKPCRMLKNDWTEAWEQPDNPKPLGMPLQMMVAIEAVSPRSCVPRSGRRREFQPGRPGHWHGDQRETDTRRGDGHGRGLHRGGGAGPAGRIVRAGVPGRTMCSWEPGA